jgi:hypothetical protein
MPLTGGRDRILKALDKEQPVWQPGKAILAGHALRGRNPARGGFERAQQARVLGSQALLTLQGRMQPRLRIAQHPERFRKRPGRAAPLRELRRQGRICAGGFGDLTAWHGV